MIHIATAHGGDKWIEIQARYLARNTRDPYRVYACAGGRAEALSDSYFYFTTNQRDGDAQDVWEAMKGPRAGDPLARLVGANFNFLAREITRGAEEEDLLVFLHGDAFPIADYIPPIRELLGSHPLVAVRRDENPGERQPHELFCATTVGFWNAIGGDWSVAEWRGPDGRPVRDNGGALLHTLEERGVEWYPLLRSNKRDLHPLWFAVYGDLVYHHGAGFRRPISRLEISTSRVHQGPRYLLAPLRRAKSRQIARRNRRIGAEVYGRIKDDEEFYRDFI